MAGSSHTEWIRNNIEVTGTHLPVYSSSGQSEEAVMMLCATVGSKTEQQHRSPFKESVPCFAPPHPPKPCLSSSPLFLSHSPSTTCDVTDEEFHQWRDCREAFG